MTRTIRMSVTMLALLACLTWFAGTAATSAFAATGDGSSIASATDLPSSSTVASLWADEIGTTGHYYFRVFLNAGDTLKADLTAGPSVSHIEAHVQAGSVWPISSAVTTEVARLTYIAPASTMYTIWVSGSTLGTFTVDPMIVKSVPYALSSFSAPGKVKHGRVFSTSLKTWPAYAGGTSPIRFYFDRKVAGHWKSYGFVRGTMSSFLTYSKFVAKTKLKSKGTYRVRARFTDATHPIVKYTAYKSIKVY